MSIAGRSDWLASVKQRLASSGFVLTEGGEGEGQRFVLQARRTRFEITKFGMCETFFLFAEFPAINRDSMRQFGADAFHHAKATRKVPLPCGLFEAVFCFPVAIVDRLDSTTADAVKTETPPKHWAAGEMPVIYDRGTGNLVYFEKTPIWGAAYYKGFRNQIQLFLGAR